jgi:hypothetical protein
MADVVHRTTVEYRKSVDTVGYDPAVWIHNPNLSALVAVPQKYWKVSGDSVLEMTAGEKTTVDQAQAAAALAADKATSKLECDLRYFKALVKILIDQFNLLRQRDAARAAALAEASTFAAYKTAMAAIATMQDITADQARTAIKNEIDAMS